MISKTHIVQNLATLNGLFLKSTSPKKSLFYSKLAILELCGWIEDSMDDIARTCVKGRLKQTANQNFHEKEVVKRIHSFLYEEHFRRMLIQSIGLINIERLEQSLDSVKFERMKIALSALKQSRDPEAHTHIVGVAKTIDAPSVTRTHLVPVYEGLKDIERKIRLLAF